MADYTNLTLYMKSGNSITIDGVIEWEVRSNSEHITYFSLKQSESCKRKLRVTTLDLSQIEALVEH